MGGFRQSLANGFGGLTRFSGRDRRRLFWPYAAMVLGFATLIWIAALSIALQDAIRRIQRFAAAHPELATAVGQGRGHGSTRVYGSPPDLAPDFGLFLQPILVTIPIVVLLLAGAVARRLHDRGRPGYWGLLPLPFLAGGLIGMQLMLQDFRSADVPDFSLLPWLLLNNILYLAALAILIGQLASAGTRGPNRYGPDPRAAEA